VKGAFRQKQALSKLRNRGQIFQKGYSRSSSWARAGFWIFYSGVFSDAPETKNLNIRLPYAESSG